MPSTHLSLHYHIVFSTKDREPHIASDWRERLHAYIGGILLNLNATPETIGGTADHAHFLIGMRATHCLSNVVRDIKAVSSRWVHKEMAVPKFAGQEGYGAFTVSATHRESVRHYIERQEEHHRTRTYQEEYLEFLHRGGVEYDQQHLW